MKDPHHCPVCRISVQPDWDQCPNCGLVLRQSATATSQLGCPRCSAPIRAGQRYCDSCAMPLDSASVNSFLAARQAYPQGLPAQQPAPARKGASAGAVVAGSLLVLGIVVIAYAFIANAGDRGPASSSLSSDPIRPEETAYFNTVSSDIGDLSNFVSQYSTESTAADLLSDNWKLRMALILSGMESSAGAIQHLTAPPRLFAIDSKLKSMAGHTIKAADLTARGIDANSDDLLQQAATEIHSASADGKDSLQLTADFRQAHK